MFNLEELIGWKPRYSCNARSRHRIVNGDCRLVCMHTR